MCHTVGLVLSHFARLGLLAYNEILCHFSLLQLCLLFPLKRLLIIITNLCLEPRKIFLLFGDFDRRIWESKILRGLFNISSGENLRKIKDKYSIKITL